MKTGDRVLTPGGFGTVESVKGTGVPVVAVRFDDGTLDFFYADGVSVDDDDDDEGHGTW